MQEKLDGCKTYKSNMCIQFRKEGMCRFGHKCCFAHGKPELDKFNRYRSKDVDYIIFSSDGRHLETIPYNPLRWN